MDAQLICQRASIMLFGFQVKILSKILATTYFVTQIFGLWPYIVDTATHHIKYNRFKLIYSIIFPAIILWCHHIFGVEKLESSRSSNVINSQTMDFLVHLIGILPVISLTQLYVGQHLQFGSSKSVYLKCVEVVELLKTVSVESTELGPYYAKFFMKTISLDVLNVLTLWYSLRKSSNVTTLHPYVPIVLYAPSLVVKFYENIFYGGMLLFHVMMKLINKKLIRILSMGKTSELYQKHNIETYCQCSDEIDKLSNLHFKLCETAKAFNSLFDIQVLLFIALQLLIHLIRLFYQYVEFVHLINSQGNYGFLVWQNLIAFVVTMTSWTEILLTSSACESLVAEVTL